MLPNLFFFFFFSFDLDFHPSGSLSRSVLVFDVLINMR